MKIIQAHNYFEDEKPLEALYVNSCGYFYDIDYDRLKKKKIYLI